MSVAHEKFAFVFGRLPRHGSAGFARLAFNSFAAVEQRNIATLT
jgi:hypothetical protein